MVCLCWLLVVVMAHVCVPGFGSACWDSSICNNLSNKERIRDCVHLCMSVIQTVLPELSASALKDNDDLLLSMVQATLASHDKMSESDLKAHSSERRAYSMEHFRWGKPSGRTRRPAKVFASSLEGGGFFEGRFPLQARRQLSEGEAKRDLNQERHQVAEKD
uniref:pro-opiomelanocortin-like n=1 Tax=Monopterus albus TaxID=43700 RepID=UPI0009B41C3D|nr:pro-opiomelanocortin-like [Monopterus albus]